MDEAKYRTFLVIARALNNRGIRPLLCGSLGLERVTRRSWNPADIDILVPGDPRGWDAPDDERIYRWSEIETMMKGLGFTLFDLHEHEMVDGTGLHVQFGAVDTLPEFANIALDELTPHHADGVDIWLLTQAQYLRLYEASLQDGYRADHEGHKDAPKVEFLRALSS